MNGIGEQKSKEETQKKRCEGKNARPKTIEEDGKIRTEIRIKAG